MDSFINDPLASFNYIRSFFPWRHEIGRASILHKLSPLVISYVAIQSTKVILHRGEGIFSGTGETAENPVWYARKQEDAMTSLWKHDVM